MFNVSKKIKVLATVSLRFVVTFTINNWCWRRSLLKRDLSPWLDGSTDCHLRGRLVGSSKWVVKDFLCLVGPPFNRLLIKSPNLSHSAFRLWWIFPLRQRPQNVSLLAPNSQSMSSGSTGTVVLAACWVKSVATKTVRWKVRSTKPSYRPNKQKPNRTTGQFTQVSAGLFVTYPAAQVASIFKENHCGLLVPDKNDNLVGETDIKTSFAAWRESIVCYTLSPPCRHHQPIYLHFAISLPLIDFQCICSFDSVSQGSVIAAPSSPHSLVLYSPSMVCLEVLLRDNAIRVQ